MSGETSDLLRSLWVLRDRRNGKPDCFSEHGVTADNLLVSSLSMFVRNTNDAVVCACGEMHALPDDSELDPCVGFVPLLSVSSISFVRRIGDDKSRDGRLFDEAGSGDWLIRDKDGNESSKETDCLI
jgi:hypothetical protein